MLQLIVLDKVVASTLGEEELSSWQRKHRSNVNPPSYYGNAPIVNSAIFLPDSRHILCDRKGVKVLWSIKQVIIFDTCKKMHWLKDMSDHLDSAQTSPSWYSIELLLASLSNIQRAQVRLAISSRMMKCLEAFRKFLGHILDKPITHTHTKKKIEMLVMLEGNIKWVCFVVS